MTHTESYSLDALQETQLAAIQSCMELQQQPRCTREFIYGLTKALELQGIEKPRIDYKKFPRLKSDRFQVILTHENEHPLIRRKTAKGKTSNQPTRPLECFVWDIPFEHSLIMNQVSCTSPVCTWFMFAHYLSLDELVVLGDAILRRNTLHEVVVKQDFEDYLDTLEHCRDMEPNRHKPHGLHKCRQALLLMREGTDSSQETRTRLSLQRHRLPCPEVNHCIQTIHRKTCFLDMAYPDAQVAIEYDGKHHASQWEEDIMRRNDIVASQWVIHIVTEEDLRSEENEQILSDTIANTLKRLTNETFVTFPPLTTAQITDKRRSTWRRRAWHTST